MRACSASSTFLGETSRPRKRDCKSAMLSASRSEPIELGLKEDAKFPAHVGAAGVGSARALACTLRRPRRRELDVKSAKISWHHRKLAMAGAPSPARGAR